MSKFTEKERKSLESNKYIKKVTDKNVQYTGDFMKLALKKYDQGVAPIDIWLEAGIDTRLFARDTFRKALHRWKEKEKKQGSKSLGIDKRGRPKGKNFKSLEEEVAYLRAENAFLKELRALEEELEDE